MLLCVCYGYTVPNVQRIIRTPLRHVRSVSAFDRITWVIIEKQWQAGAERVILFIDNSRHFHFAFFVFILGMR